MRTDVAALYVDPRGPYPGLVREWYDATRDARGYAGSLPVVAHPPCGPWSVMRHLSKETTKDCAPLALEAVRRCGGVLEHPRGSTFFAHVALRGRFGRPHASGARTARAHPLGFWEPQCPTRTGTARDQGLLRRAAPPDARGFCRMAARTCLAMSRTYRQSTGGHLARWISSATIYVMKTEREKTAHQAGFYYGLVTVKGGTVGIIWSSVAAGLRTKGERAEFRRGLAAGKAAK